jgi:hypothetical protein
MMSWTTLSKLAQNPHDFWMVGEPTSLPSFLPSFVENLSILKRQEIHNE